METELENRIQKAWKTFFAHKKQLCHRGFSIKRRFQLFNATVSAVMLYGSGTWALKSDDLKRMQGEQRKMLRMMLQTPRRIIQQNCSAEDSSDSEGEPDENEIEEEGEKHGLLEDCVTWVQRATQVAEAELARAHVTDWVREQRKRYWDFAGRVARCSDERWSHAVLNWTPSFGSRNVGAPRKRWKDDVANFCLQDVEDDWFLLAQDEFTWNAMRDRFIDATFD